MTSFQKIEFARDIFYIALFAVMGALCLEHRYYIIGAASLIVSIVFAIWTIALISVRKNHERK